MADHEVKKDDRKICSDDRKRRVLQRGYDWAKEERSIEAILACRTETLIIIIIIIIIIVSAI